MTGVAGFIGMHSAKKLLDEGHEIIGIDNLNDYYDVSLKEDRLQTLKDYKNFRFLKLDIKDQKDLLNLFKKESPQRVLHLAAQAGVRYSIQNPYVYIDSNIQGFINVLEGCRATKTEHLVFASSSSVYGGNEKTPFSEHDNVDHPISLYAATKKANELMAHTYSHLYQIPSTGLRFFTVYGPWGRPDMALFLFTKAQPNIHDKNIFEFRGVWVATVENIDWPSKRGLSNPAQKEEFIALLDRHQKNGMNAIIMQVRPSGDALYPSTLEPWSEYLMGTQGLPPSPFYDPLEFMIAETHKRGGH